MRGYERKYEPLFVGLKHYWVRVEALITLKQSITYYNFHAINKSKKKNTWTLTSQTTLLQERGTTHELTWRMKIMFSIQPYKHDLLSKISYGDKTKQTKILSRTTTKTMSSKTICTTYSIDQLNHQMQIPTIIYWPSESTNDTFKIDMEIS